jgi:hypothetical protein
VLIDLLFVSDLRAAIWEGRGGAALESSSNVIRSYWSVLQLWIQRLNAAATEHGVSYNVFMHQLAKVWGIQTCMHGIVVY